MNRPSLFIEHVCICFFVYYLVNKMSQCIYSNAMRMFVELTNVTYGDIPLHGFMKRSLFQGTLCDIQTCS